MVMEQAVRTHTLQVIIHSKYALEFYFSITPYIKEANEIDDR